MKHHLYYYSIVGFIMLVSGFNIIQALRYHHDIGFLSSAIFVGSLLTLIHYVVRGRNHGQR